MIGRQFIKHLRLLNGRHETIKTRFELEEGKLVEHVVIQTHDRPASTPAASPASTPAAPPPKRPSAT